MTKNFALKQYVKTILPPEKAKEMGERDLADLIHKYICHSDHTDQCSYDYLTWADHDNRLSLQRKKGIKDFAYDVKTDYLLRARSLIDAGYDYETVKKVLELVHKRRYPNE